MTLKSSLNVVTGKTRLRSKTYGFNGALVALALAALGFILASPELGAWVKTLPPEVYPAAVVIIGFLNMVIREYTTQPLKGREPERES